MKRGQIRHIRGSNRLGVYDTKKSRPAVIVSGDEILENSTTVEVVYMTTHPWNDLPTHVVINATGVESTLLCERVAFVDSSQVGELIGECTAEEMKAIDRALLLALGIETHGEVIHSATPEGLDAAEVLKPVGERDAYKQIVDKLLGERRG